MRSFITTVAAHPIIVFFLLANLAIGFWAHTKAKANSFEDYALASRSLPTGVLVMTLLATLVSNWVISAPDFHFQYGLVNIIPIIIHIMSFVLVGTFLAPYLVYFDDCITLGDLMKKFYGSWAQIITGWIGCIFSFLIISSQVRAMAVIGTQFFDLSPITAIVCFGGFVVLYSLWGGMRVISYTDVVQIIGALIVFTWIGSYVIQKLEGIQGLWNGMKANPSKSYLFSYQGDTSLFYYRLKSGLFYNLSGASILYLPIMQRMLIVRDKRVVRHMWYLGATLFTILYLMATVIGIGLVVGQEKFDLADQTDNLFLGLIRYMFKEKSWGIGCVFVSFLGILLSTMDSHLHAVGISIAQDIINPIRVFLGKENLSVHQKTFYARMGIAVIGVLAVLLGLFEGSSLHSRNLQHGVVFISTIVLVPLIIGIIGVKTDTFSWLNFFLVYSGLIFFLSRYNWHRYDCYLIALHAGIFTYFITHLWQNKGLVTFKRSEQTIAEQLWLPTWQGTVTYFKSWLFSPLQLHILAGRKIVNSPTQSLPFSMLIFALYTFSSVMTGGKADMGLANFMAGVHVIGITLCCGLMLEGIWPDKLKPYFALYWFATLFYCLPLGGTLAFLRAHEGAVSSILWVSSFAVLAFLVDSNTFCLLSMLGAGLSIVIWRLIIGYLPNDLWNDSSLTGAGILVLMVISILLFSRSREQHSSQRLNWNRTASSILGHDLRNTANMLSGVANVINSTFKMSEPAANTEGKQGYWIEKQHGKFLEDYAQKLTQKSTDTKREIKNFMDFMEQQVIGWLEQEKMSMHKTVKDVVASMKDKYASSMQITISCPKDFEANVFSVFPNVIANLIKNASLHGQATKVTVKVDGVKRTLTVRDNGKGISADVLPRIFDLNFTTGDKGKKNAGVGLAFVKMVMNASSGKISCHSRKGDKKSFTEFAMELPEA